MIGKDNYLLYMIVINIAPPKEWNENSPKICLVALNVLDLL